VEIPGSVAVVTGGASGLGEAVVRAVVAEGGRAGIVDLPESRGGEVADELGPSVRFFPADITAPEQVESAIGDLVTAFGRLDLTVNSAGINPGGRVLGENRAPDPLDTFRAAVDVNLVGLFDVCRWSAHHMAANDPGEDGERGLIVNVASIAGLEGQAGQTAYAASKGGVIALTLPLAQELAAEGIRVVAIAPGMMDTRMFADLPEDLRGSLVDLHQFPKRLGAPEELARLVLTCTRIRPLNGEVVRLDAAARLPSS
jgi:3-hydroxyacyl-CoA dehydrogenase / 3-hydroxy-2-methylbutyryl-CoA dehydrogenase